MDKNLYYETNESDIFPDPVDRDKIATENNIVIDKLARDPSTFEIRQGTMPVFFNERYNVQLTNKDATYVFPNGYYENLTLYIPSIQGKLDGTATAEDIVAGKTAVVNGVLITGTLDKAQNDQDSTATAADIKDGATAWVRGRKITGSMKINPRADKVLIAEQSYTIPEGYHFGTSVISVSPLVYMTPGSATAEDIKKNRTAWVEGVMINGTFDPDKVVSDYIKKLKEFLEDPNNSSYSIATGSDILENKVALVNGGLAKGTIPTYSNTAPVLLRAGQSYIVPQGYYDGTTMINGVSLSDQTSATATQNDVREGKTAWVNGERIVGKMTQTSTATDTTATRYDILAGKTAYINGNKVTGECLYNIISYYESSDNKDEPLGVVVHRMLDPNWNFFDIIQIDMIDVNTGHITKQEILREFKAGSKHETPDYLMTSTYGSDRIVIMPTHTDSTKYIRVTFIGYSMTDSILNNKYGV